MLKKLFKSKVKLSIIFFCLVFLFIGTNFIFFTNTTEAACDCWCKKSDGTTYRKSYSATSSSACDTLCKGVTHTMSKCTPKSGSSSNTTVYSANLDNPIAYDTGIELIGGLVKAFLGVIGALTVLVIVYGGVLYITSAGNEENLKKAKGAVTGAVIGLAVALLAYVLVDFVIKTLGA